MEKRPKVKISVNSDVLRKAFGCQSIENTAKSSVLDRLYGEKHVNYCVFDGKHWKNIVKNNVLEGFLVLYICLSWPAALEHGKIEEKHYIATV